MKSRRGKPKDTDVPESCYSCLSLADGRRIRINFDLSMRASEYVCAACRDEWCMMAKSCNEGNPAATAMRVGCPYIAEHVMLQNTPIFLSGSVQVTNNDRD